MNDATLRAFQTLWTTMKDAREFSARDFELRDVKTLRNAKNNQAVEADGTKWMWDDNREVWRRTI